MNVNVHEQLLLQLRGILVAQVKFNRFCGRIGGRSALQPRPGASHHMDVQVTHFLAALIAGVDHNPEAAVRIGTAPFLQRQFRGQGHHSPKQSLVLDPGLGQ